ncbi:hypothetical protein V6N13_045875 [Hibiscus sabdariffa]|uniref:Uncharacterized protein n=2 Tax=Hibiscus sabdariffa TaxID=183260 RepID=A0ABR2NIT6_9ROSI
MIDGEGCLGRDFNDDEKGNMSSGNKGFLMEESLDWWFGRVLFEWGVVWLAENGSIDGMRVQWTRAVDGELQWLWESSIVVMGGEVERFFFFVFYDEDNKGE